MTFFDKLHHLSLSLMPAPYMLNIALWVYYAYLYVVLNEDMNENFNITVKAVEKQLMQHFFSIAHTIIYAENNLLIYRVTCDTQIKIRSKLSKHKIF
jgi:hypothetical protein